METTLKEPEHVVEFRDKIKEIRNRTIINTKEQVSEERKLREAFAKEYCPDLTPRDGLIVVSDMFGAELVPDKSLKEVEELSDRLLIVFKKISPKVAGLEMREVETKGDIQMLKNSVDQFRAEMFHQQGIFRDSVKVFQEYIEEERNKSLFRKVIDHIKCRLSNTKS